MKPQIYRLAAFPLNLILLPGEEIPIRIFEPRYKQLIDECLTDSKTFGIPYLHEGEISTIGSEVEIVRLVGRNDNDDMVILIRGKSLYKTIEFFPILQDKLYGGTVSQSIITDFTTQNPDVVVKVKKLRLNVNDKLGTFVRGNGISILDIAKSIMLKSDDKHKLLSLNSESAREQFIINQLSFVEMIREQEGKLEHDFNLN